MRIRNIVIGIVVLSLVGSGLLFIRSRRPARAQVGLNDRTYEVKLGAIEVWVTGTGEIAPAAQTMLVFNVSGNIGALHAQVGDHVRAGDVLVELDPASLDAGLIAAEADLIAARQQLETLLEPPTEQQLAQSQLAVVQAQQALKDAQRRLRNIKSPSVSAAEDRVDDAQLAYDTAQANLQLATVSQQATALSTAQNNLNLATSQLQEAQARYDACLEISCGERVFIEARLTAVKNSYQSALDAFLTAQLQYETTLTNQQNTLGNAAEALKDAEQNLSAARVGPDTLDVALAEVQATVASADLAQAQQALADLQAGPEPDDVAAAQARWRAGQAQVNQTRLTAPFDATVMVVNYQVGDTVTPGRVAVVLADLRRLHVDTTVDELDIASVRIGQPVELTLDALPGVRLSGQVAEMDLAPASGTASTEYPVQVELVSTEAPVRVGMTAALSILVARKENVLLVPNWALRLDADTGEVYVTVQGAGGLSRTTVTLGLRNDADSEVLAGLQPGSVVGVVSTPEPARVPGFFGGGG